jgi:hypothetical protein
LFKFVFFSRLDLTNNYNTITHTQYQPYRVLDGLEELPAKVSDHTSAFTQTAYNHNTLEKDVLGLYVDTKIRAPYDVLPNHKARLHLIKNKDPLPRENHNHVFTCYLS